jgi:hypothetical protein
MESIREALFLFGRFDDDDFAVGEGLIEVGEEIGFEEFGLRDSSGRYEPAATLTALSRDTGGSGYR